MILSIMFFGVLVIAGLSFSLLALIVGERRRKVSELSARCQSYAERVGEYEDAARLVLPQAQRYMNSLSGDCQKAMLRVRRVLNLERSALERAWEQVQRGKSEDLLGTENILRKHFENGMYGSNPWEIEVREALGVVSAGIRKAALAAEQLRVGSSRASSDGFVRPCVLGLSRQEPHPSLR